ncbi:MAG: RNA-binding protein [Gammaproteobacteria bacterium SHHR-1]|uniref:RNA recognition motif domain-containing protein n=1 Tax=Magnetovirga frankeli TaxID=947516 RepID=UPI001292D305|nr:RNA-binding protein [gamma proteobacterium SS-5]
MINIYVGNLPYSVRDDELKEMFSGYGEVASAKVIMDRDTNRSKGFGFVEMSDNSAGASAIEAMNGADMGGRPLRVNEARPRENSPRGGGGGGFRRG